MSLTWTAFVSYMDCLCFLPKLPLSLTWTAFVSNLNCLCLLPELPLSLTWTVFPTWTAFGGDSLSQLGVQYGRPGDHLTQDYLQHKPDIQSSRHTQYCSQGAQTKRPKTKRRKGQNVPRQNTFQDIRSQGQNVPRDKTSQGQSVPHQFSSL